jgi:putative aminopeptidase FrvX
LNVLAWALGINLLTGRLLPPSQGAVDNGSSCAILLGLAKRLVNAEVDLGKTRLTLALFCGEEVNMQGSRAYVHGREWPLPAQAVNLEVMAQDGDYVYWEQDGFVLHLEPTSESVNQRVIRAITAVTGKPPRPVGPVISDGYSFLSVGIPAATIGTYDRRWIDTGFHHPTDNLDRVMMSRLEEGVEILLHFLHQKKHHDNIEIR